MFRGTEKKPWGLIMVDIKDIYTIFWNKNESCLDGNFLITYNLLMSTKECQLLFSKSQFLCTNIAVEDVLLSLWKDLFLFSENMLRLYTMTFTDSGVLIPVFIFLIIRASINTRKTWKNPHPPLSSGKPRQLRKISCLWPFSAIWPQNSFDWQTL